MTIPDQYIKPETLIIVFAVIGLVRVLIHVKKYGVEVASLVRTIIDMAVLLLIGIIIYSLVFGEF